MTIPAVMFIEMALDNLKNIPKNIIDAEIKELHSLGTRVNQLGVNNFSNDFIQGYLLGLQTLRVILYGNPAAIQAGINEEIL